MITVNFGTFAFDTAVTIFAPCRAMPSFSYLRPTMKPVMFCRNTSGILRWQQLDEMRALHRRFGEQDAVVRDDPDRVAPDVREARDERRAVARLSSNSESSTMRAITSRTSNGLRVSTGITPYRLFAS